MSSQEALALRRSILVPRLFSRLPGRRFVLIVAASIAVLALVMAIFAPLLAPDSPNVTDFANTLAPPGGEHLLGTDNVGRDILSRLIYGARLSLLGPLVVVLLSTAIGVPMGLAAGYLGGWVDGILARSWDVLLAFPSLLLAIVVVAAFGAGFLTATIAIAVVYTPLVARVVRGLVLAERSRTYVEAMRTLGFGKMRIASRHILPNIGNGILAQATLNFGYALLDLAGLSFIGLGVQPPDADWGTMLAQGRADILLAPTEALVPAAAIILVAISFNLLGDAVSDRLQRR